MKTALVIIPSMNGCIDKEAYLADCIRMIAGEGYLPFSPDIYKQYTTINYWQFIEQILPVSEEVFLFQDFKNGDKSKNSRETIIIELINSIDEKKPIRRRTLLNGIDYYRYNLKSVLKDVSKKTGISLDALRSKMRMRGIVDARYVYYRRAKELTKKKYSHAKIGSLVNKDHATVTSGLKHAYNTREVIELYNKCFDDD